jgi:hypothetical protein
MHEACPWFGSQERAAASTAEAEPSRSVRVAARPSSRHRSRALARAEDAPDALGLRIS